MKAFKFCCQAFKSLLLYQCLLFYQLCCFCENTRKIYSFFHLGLETLDDEETLKRNQIIGYILYKKLLTVGVFEKNTFTINLVGHDKGDEIKDSLHSANKNHYILEVACYAMQNKFDFLGSVNKALEDANLSGKVITDTEINKYLNRESKDYEKIVDEKFKTCEKFRKYVYNTIVEKACDDTRVIAHFLLPPEKVIEINTDYSNKVKERLNEVLMAWDKSSRDDKRTWKKLRALLNLLKQEKIITTIERADCVPLQDSDSLSEELSTISIAATIDISNMNGNAPTVPSDGDLDCTDSHQQVVEFEPGTLNVVANHEIGAEKLTNTSHNYEKMKSFTVYNDMSTILRKKLVSLLDDECPVARKFYYVILAERLQFPEKDIRVLRLRRFPALHFIDSLCIRDGDTEISELKKEMLKDDGNYPIETFSILDVLGDLCLRELSHENKVDLASSLSLEHKIPENNWKNLAEMLEYSKIDIMSFEQQSYLNESSPTDALLKKIQICSPRMTFLDLANYLADIGHQLAKSEIENFVDEKVQRTNTRTRTNTRRVRDR